MCVFLFKYSKQIQIYIVHKWVLRYVPLIRLDVKV